VRFQKTFRFTEVKVNIYARFEVFTAVAMKNASSGMLGRVVVFLRSVRQLLVTASVVPSSPILFTLMKEALSSSETSVLTRDTWRNCNCRTILLFFAWPNF
jgi:hypothetical protein